MQKKSLKNPINKLLSLTYVYLTPLPYLIYNISLNDGNIGNAGLGVGLIQSQRIFWISNVWVTLLDICINPL
jgi:hypothetical protein